MNVLLVDDEDYVLDYLEENIDWPALGIAGVYRAGSAQDAMLAVREHAISVMITDIRMPERSGLELLSDLRLHQPELKVILLTGYSEFEYAKQALRNGASDYLLKPVTAEEVELSLKEALASIQQTNENQEKLRAAADVIRYGGARIREHLLFDLVLGKRYPLNELRLQMSELRLPLAPEDDGILALLRIETSLIDSKDEDLALFHYAIVNMAEEIFGSRGIAQPSLWTCSDSHHYLVMLLPVRHLGGAELVYACMNQLHSAIKTHVKRTASILLSRPVNVYEQLNQTYVQSLSDFGSLIGTQRDVWLTRDHQSAERKMLPLVRLYEAPTFMQLMDSGRWAEASGRLEGILEELDQPDYRTQEHAAEVVHHLYNCFSYLAHKQGDSIASLIGPSASPQQPRLYSVEAIRDWAVPIMDQFRETLIDGTGGHNRVIRQVHDYINRNLASDLSLHIIGEHVYLHPVYLSRLYKKETGESLSAYITRIRLEQAAKLLVSTNKKVADIAIEVGYHKTQYFISLFKDHYGHTPQAFRNQ